jgi:multidrug resistance efflux pump
VIPLFFGGARGEWDIGLDGEFSVNDDAWPAQSGPHDAGKRPVNGSRWRASGDSHGYPDGHASYREPGTADGRRSQLGRHRGESGAPDLWVYDADQPGDTRPPSGNTGHYGGVPHDPFLPRGSSTRPRAASPGGSAGTAWEVWGTDPPGIGEFQGVVPRALAPLPPARLNDWSAGYQGGPPGLPARAHNPPAVYQETYPMEVPAASYGLASLEWPASPAVPQTGAVSRSRERVRGMNAALETGVAGVGELAPARQPARPRQMVLAVLVAAVGLVAGVLTYKSLVSGAVSFGGEVVPAHVYALSFGATGTVTAVKVSAGEHVTAGEVLATQADGLALANLQAAKDAEAAASAAVYVDQHPHQSIVTNERDSVASAQASLASVTARVSSTDSRESAIVSERQQAVNSDATAFSGQCGSSTTSSTCQALATTLATAKRELAEAQAAAAADRTAGQQQEQSAQSLLGQRQAALQQVESQASGVTVTLDEATQRLAAAEAAVAQDQVALEGTTIVATASGTVAAVSAATGDVITGSDLRNPVVTVDSGPLVVSAQLPGTEIGAIRTGQPVTLDIEPLRVSLPGKIVQISQVASGSQTVVSYTAICQIEPNDLQLMAGMSVNITPR